MLEYYERIYHIFKDFTLENIECEIENMEKDIPFLHCSLRMSRTFNSYVWRIFVPVFVITLNSTLVFRFSSDIAERLNYIVANLLTVVGFLYILASILPQISYLTIVDQFMLFSLIFVGSMSIICVSLDCLGLDDPNGVINNRIFAVTFCLNIISHIFLIFYCMYVRDLEHKKLLMNRHEIELLEYNRLNGDMTSQDEFLVHTYIHPEKTTELVDGSKHFVYEGTHRKDIYPDEAAGWLFEGKGELKADRKIGKRGKNLFSSRVEIYR